MKYQITLGSIFATLLCCSLNAFDTQATNSFLQAVQEQSSDNMVMAIYKDADIHAFNDKALLLALENNFVEGIQILCDYSLPFRPYSMLLIMLIIYDLETNEQYTPSVVEPIINILRHYLFSLELNLNPRERDMLFAAHAQNYIEVERLLHVGADILVGDGYLLALATLYSNKTLNEYQEDEDSTYLPSPLLTLLFTWIKENYVIDCFSMQTMKKISRISQGLGYKNLFDTPDFPIIPIRTCSCERPKNWNAPILTIDCLSCSL